MERSPHSPARGGGCRSTQPLRISQLICRDSQTSSQGKIRCAAFDLSLLMASVWACQSGSQTVAVMRIMRKRPTESTAPLSVIIEAFLRGLAHLYNLVPYQRRAQHAGQCGVEVEGGKVPTRDWFLNLQILTSGGLQCVAETLPAKGSEIALAPSPQNWT